MVTIIIKIDTCTSTRRICFPNLMIFSSMASLNGSGLPDTSSLISYHRFENLPSGLNPVRKFARLTTVTLKPPCSVSANTCKRPDMPPKPAPEHPPAGCADGPLPPIKYRTTKTHRLRSSVRPLQKHHPHRIRSNMGPDCGVDLRHNDLLNPFRHFL